MTIQEFKTEYKLITDKHDVWGECMSVWFAVAAELHYRNSVTIPAEWNYRPSPIMGDTRERENYWFELFESSTDDELIEIGNVMHQLSEILKKQGRDY